MKLRAAISLTLSLLALGLILGPMTALGLDDEEAPAREKKAGEKKKRAGKEEKKKDSPLDPMMEAFMKAGTPGEAHKVLKRFEGRWDGVSKFWMAPGAEPMEEKGRMTCRLIFGGRYLSQEFRGQWSGMEFQGIGYLGHDNVKKKYVGSWVDSMSTGIMTSEGTFDEGSRSFKMTGSYSDPIKGGTKTMRFVTTFIDEDHIREEGFDVGPDGKEFKNMEIVYTRRRAASDEDESGEGDEAKPRREGKRKGDEAKARKEGSEN